MPSWGDILQEFTDSQRRRGPQLGADSDAIRRKYIGRLRDLTGHAVIVYGSGWLKSSGESHPDFSVQGADVHALMEMCKDVEDRKLDLILHSPGGEVGAAEQIVRYLRTQFDYIRAFVPLQAKSAATMIALGCDEIVWGTTPNWDQLIHRLWYAAPKECAPFRHTQSCVTSKEPSGSLLRMPAQSTHGCQSYVGTRVASLKSANRLSHWLRS